MLSKSQYMAFLHCPKEFWLFRNRPDLISTLTSHQQSIIADRRNCWIAGAETLSGRESGRLSTRKTGRDGASDNGL